MKIALYRSVRLDIEYPREYSKRLEEDSDYVRTSEIVDVEFPMLPIAEVNNKEIAILRRAKKEIQSEAEVRLRSIDLKINDLLALPNLKEHETSQ